VQPITRGGLCHLHTPNCGMPAQNRLQVWSGFQGILQSPDFYPKSVPRDLDHRPQRTAAQANRSQCSCKAFIADYASFGGLSVFHYDHEGNQTSIQKIRKLQLSPRLVQD